MAQATTERVALMAIKPCYSQRILSGSKRVEFRKTAFRSPVSHVVIYESGTTGKVVGFFEVAGVERGTPSELWERFADVGGVDESDYRKYFQSCSSGVAIRIGSVTALEPPLDIFGLNPQYRPPQSFFYITNDEFQRVKRDGDAA